MTDSNKITRTIEGHEVTVEFESWGVSVSIDGYSTQGMFNGSVVYVDLFKRSEHPIVHVWGDINKEDPTHVISLRDSARDQRVCYLCNFRRSLPYRLPHNGEDICEECWLAFGAEVEKYIYCFHKDYASWRADMLSVTVTRQNAKVEVLYPPWEKIEDMVRIAARKEKV